jgi:cell division protein FtsQ
VTSTPRAHAARVVVPLSDRRKKRQSLQARVPTGRTIALLFAALVTLVGLYLIALESSLFAIRTVEIRGAPPALTRQIDDAIGRFRGHSLVGLDQAEIERAVLGIPAVQTVRIDRDFPNTLRIFVKREFPVAVLRRGTGAWLIAASGKVVRGFPLGRGGEIPRIWVPSSMPVVIGERIGNTDVRIAVGLLGSLGSAGRSLRLANVIALHGELTLVTRSGVELRFGDASQARLKLAVAEKILPQMAVPAAGSTAYLDISLPERPVSGTTSKSKTKR